MPETVGGLAPWRLVFSPSPVCMGFVVDKVILGWDFPRVLWFSPVIVSSPVLHAESAITHTT